MEIYLILWNTKRNTILLCFIIFFFTGYIYFKNFISKNNEVSEFYFL